MRVANEGMKMNILSVENVSKTYGDKTLLDRVSFGIEEGERIGLIGVNGAGKSTLLKVIAGLEKPETGNIALSQGAVIHYLPQEPVFDQGETILNQVFAGDMPVMRLLREYEALLLQEDQGATYQRQLIRLQEQLDQSSAWQLEHEAKTILTKLGITQFERVVGTLSGGERKRVALARAFISPCDLLILDEPTNHIDHEHAMWLEEYLQKRKGALFMVTHDRYLLDRLVNRIFELDFGHIYRYTGGYHAFIEAKLAREESQRASEEKRQNFLRNEINWILRGARARSTKSKVRTQRYYDVLEQAPAATHDVLELSSVASRLGKTVIELEHVNTGFGEQILIRNFTYLVLRHDRLGIVGPNGSGKSTLLKIMAGQLVPDQGTVTIGATVKIGYFLQEHEDMTETERVIDYVRKEAEWIDMVDGKRLSAAQLLERFLFPASMQWTPIAKLSGGEKRRLALVRILMSAPNVLLLDEPTNDLDIPTLSILESFLDDFAGAVIVVSHDRYFLDRVAEKIFAFEGHGEITSYNGNFTDYLAKRPMLTDLAKQVDGHGQRSEQLDKTDHSRQRRKTLKFTYQEQKDFEQIDQLVANAEEALNKILQQMEQAASDYGKIEELFKEKRKLELEIDHLIERWTYLNERAEEIEKSRQS